MAIVNASASNSAFGVQAGYKPVSGVPVGMAGDCLLFDGVEPAVYRVQGTKAQSKGTMTETGMSAYLVPHALKRQVTRRELWASNGRLLEGDVAFEIPRLELPVQPRPGDLIYLDGRWSVLAADEATLRTRWRVFARIGA